MPDYAPLLNHLYLWSQPGSDHTFPDNRVASGTDLPVGWPPIGNERRLRENPDQKLKGARLRKI